MAKRNKKDHKHWIPLRRKRIKWRYIIGVDPIDENERTVQTFMICGRQKQYLMVRSIEH